ncbi:MAG: DUF417 family protein [Patescibacteria group bacterium]
MKLTNNTLPHLKRAYEDKIVVILRYSLAIIFVWFGLLKIFGFNPVFDLINAVMPTLAVPPGLIFLGVFETAIGIGLLVNKARPIVHVLLLLHLAGTFLSFIMGTEIVFQPHFPILSLAGEFVIKNMTLAIAGLVVLLHESHRARTARFA